LHIITKQFNKLHFVSVFIPLQLRHIIWQYLYH